MAPDNPTILDTSLTRRGTNTSHDIYSYGELPLGVGYKASASDQGGDGNVSNASHILFLVIFLLFVIIVVLLAVNIVIILWSHR